MPCINPNPPRKAERLLRWCLPGGLLGSSILGDLEQEFRRLAGAGSIHEARIWYWRQSLSVGLPFLGRRIVRILLNRGARKPHSSTGGIMSKLLQDVRSAWRSLRRSPLLTAAASAMIAIGVGAATAMFSIVHGVLLTPLSFNSPQSLVSIIVDNAEHGVRHSFSYPDFRDVEDQVASLQGVGARWSRPATLKTELGSEEVNVGWVTFNYFDVLDITPLAGRTFRAGEENAVLLGHGIWQRRYGSSRDILGQALIIGGAPLRVIGVLPPGVDPNLSALDGSREANEVWRPMPKDWLQGEDRSMGWLRVAGRIGPGSNLHEAQAELDALADRIAESDPMREPGDVRFVVMTAREHLVEKSRPYLAALMAAVVFLLLVACSNVANLMLARGQERRSEMAVRCAMGAGRAALFRQLLAESLTIAAIGGAAGLLLCAGVIRAAPSFLPAALPRSEAVGIDWPVLLFALAASLTAAVLAGIAPALRSHRIAPTLALTGRSGGSGLRPRRFSQGLVAAQVALSLILLLSGGHLLKSFSQLLQTHPGFRSEGVLTLSLTLSNRWKDAREGTLFMQDFLEEVGSIPGVLAVGHTNRIPLGGGLYDGEYALRPSQVEEPSKPSADFRFVSPDYFSAMGTQVLSGRAFEESDRGDAAIVDQVFARKAWPGREAVGQRIWSDPQFGQGGWSRVVGVVENMRHQSVSEEGRATVFFPVLEVRPGQRRHVAVSTTLPPLSIVDEIRTRLSAPDPGAALSGVRPLEGMVAHSISPHRFAVILVGVFAGVALILSMAGLYAVVSHSVSRRTRELGIRIALGADRTRMLRLVLGQGLSVTLIGAAAGFALSLLLTRLLSSLLFGISTVDPATNIAVASLLLISALASCCFPALRALRTDPAAAVRSD